MGDINVNIYEGEAFESRITLKEINPGIYKIDSPIADPDRIFIRNGDDVKELAMYALMHLSNKEFLLKRS